MTTQSAIKNHRVITSSTKRELIIPINEFDVRNMYDTEWRGRIINNIEHEQAKNCRVGITIMSGHFSLVTYETIANNWRIQSKQDTYSADIWESEMRDQIRKLMIRQANQMLLLIRNNESLFNTIADVINDTRRTPAAMDAIKVVLLTEALTEDSIKIFDELDDEDKQLLVRDKHQYLYLKAEEIKSLAELVDVAMFKNIKFSRTIKRWYEIRRVVLCRVFGITLPETMTYT